ncbi:MAG: Ig-like domain-containing protein, partial [Pirellulales bacterium]
RDDTPTITGSGTTGHEVTLLDSNNVQVVGPFPVANNNWSIALAVPLVPGSNQLRAFATDQNGTKSLLFDAATIELDDTNPGPLVPADSTSEPTPTSVNEFHMFRGTATEPEVFITFFATSDAGDIRFLGTTESSSTANGGLTYDYEFQASVPLPAGLVSVVMDQSDRVGNPGISATVFLDVTPVGAGLTITPSLRDGESPVITGTGIPGATIELKGDDDLNGGTSEVVLGTATVDDEENWTIISSEPFTGENGPVSLTATQTNSAFPSDVQTITGSISLDTTPPAAVTLENGGVFVSNLIYPEITGSAGAVSDADDEHVVIVTITVTKADPADNVVYVFEGPVPNGGGDWSVTSPQPIPEGTWNFEVVQRDKAGNESSAETGTISVLTTPGQPPSFTLIPGVTFVEEPVLITGTGLPGATITLTGDHDADGPTGTADIPLGTTTVDANGNWEIQVSDFDDAAVGDAIIRVTQTDAAGNVSTERATTISLDLTAAPAPLVFDALNPTNDQTPVISGTGHPGRTITLSADINQDGNLVEVGSAVVSAIPVDDTVPEEDKVYPWSITVPPQFGFPGDSAAPVTIALEATQTDSVGVPGTPVTGSIDIDLSAPAAPSITPPGVTNNPLPTITGGGLVDSTIVLSIDTTGDGVPDTVLGTAPVVDDGSGVTGTWSVTSGVLLTDGTRTLVAFQVNALGNVSERLDGSITIDRTAPEVPVITPLSDSGTPNLTPLPRPAITGTAEVGADVEVIATGESFDKSLGTATVGADGTWTLPALAFDLPEGVVSLAATATDEAGNLSPEGALEIVVDRTPPDNLEIDAISLVSTNDGTPTITGKGEAGATVELRADVDGDGSANTVIGTGVVGNDLRWSITSSTVLPEGTISLSSTQTDAAGNEGVVPVLDQINIDQTAPANPDI